MTFLDWLLAAPMWVKASLSCLWWLAFYMPLRLLICVITGASFWTFDPADALSFAAVSYLLGWRHRGQV